jgi:hypothetical protein
MNDGEIFTHADFPSLKFRVHIEPDDNSDPPWENSDGHGPVRGCHQWRSRPTKRPGERVLHQDRGTYWFYDWQEACKLARKAGWNAPPYDAPDRIHRAVQADFDFLRGYLTGDWHYVGVCVSVIDDDGDDLTEKYEHAVWGFDSNDTSGIAETARDMASEAGKEYIATLWHNEQEASNKALDAADAARWRKLRAVAKCKDLGTVVEDDGHLRSPLYRRWYFDTPDLTAGTLDAAIDSLPALDNNVEAP